MKKITWSALGLLVLIGMSCAPSYRITSDYERGVNFNAFKTYQILKQNDRFDVGSNPINRQRIERAIMNEMAFLDFKVQKNPDLLVGYFIKEKTVRQVDYYHYYHGRWGYPGWLNVREYKVGSLVIDLIDARKKKVLWHGVALGGMTDDQLNLEQKIKEIVQSLFDRFELQTLRDRDMALIE